MKNKKKKLLFLGIGGGSILSFISLFVVVNLIVLYCVAVKIYSGSFDDRHTTSIENRFVIEDFPSMKRERHTFETRHGIKLVGYLYEDNDESNEEKGVVVFAHGLGGGGQTGYMDIFDILTQNDYYVFAYDATANDESEGDVVGGLPQGFIDLDYAISYAQTIEEINSLPFVLMGYSWGGLSVTNVLNYHPEVKAVASLAGWNKSMNLIDYRGTQMVGPIGKVLLPFASIYEFVKYGKYAFSTSMKGFRKSDCAVMVIHSEDDETIPIKYGFEKYYKKYKDNDRFTFKLYNGRGHAVLTDENGNLDKSLINDIVSFYNANID